MIDKGNHKFFLSKKSEEILKLWMFVRIRPGSGFVIIGTGSADPDPCQNETDPQHCQTGYYGESWNTSLFLLQFLFYKNFEGNFSGVSNLL